MTRRLRILFVSHPRLRHGVGAAQTALDFRDALAARGHDAIAWSPEPVDGGPLGWNKWLEQRLALERFLAASPPFDVVDAPPVSISAPLTASRSLLVGRSIQPDFLYLRSQRAADRRGGVHGLAWWLANQLRDVPLRRGLVGGWRRADLALCLGSLEHTWMRDRFPALREKLRSYDTAPNPAERLALAEVAHRRRPFPGGGVRWLWIGRWVPHKGISTLVDLIRQRLVTTSDRFTIAGCGEVAPRALDPDWQASGRVAVVPSFGRAELLGLLASHNAGLFTSEVEGWGLSVQEMLESGLPVFATRAGCVPDLAPSVEEGLGELPLPPDLPSGLAVRLSPRYYERFDWARIAASYEGMCEAMMERKAR